MHNREITLIKKTDNLSKLNRFVKDKYCYAVSLRETYVKTKKISFMKTLQKLDLRLKVSFF